MQVRHSDGIITGVSVVWEMRIRLKAEMRLKKHRGDHPSRGWGAECGTVWHRLGDGLGVMPFPVRDVFVSTNPNSVHSGGTTEDIHCRSDSNGLDCSLNLGLWVSASQYLV